MHRVHKYKGAATLIMAVVLLILSTLVIMFATNFSLLQEKANSNLVRNNQAYEAAEAGLDFGMAYLQQNSSTILANPSNGYIRAFSNAQTTNVALPNGSTYSIVYTNPIPYNYRLIRVTATGRNSDNTSTRVLSQDIQTISILPNSINTPVYVKGAVSIGGNSTITNLTAPTSVIAGGNITFSGSGKTITALGTLVNGPDTQGNVAAVAALSATMFFANIFSSQDTGAVQSFADNYYQSATNQDYSSTINGMTNKVIWIDQATGTTATIGGTTNLGSLLNPILLVVNGNLALTGDVNLYGYIYVLGSDSTTTMSNNVRINGAFSTAGNLTMSGTSTITYNSLVLTILKALNSTRYSKIPGSWTDF